MIEIVLADRCTSCDICIRVCPTNVFDKRPDGVPVIARQSDCQTCFMCEAYCPDDALYVSPLVEPAPAGSVHLDVAELTSAGTLGSYRRAIGWQRPRPARSAKRRQKDATKVGEA